MPRAILAVTLCAGLAACSAPQLAATGTRAALSEQTVATIAGICRQAQPFIPLAAAIPSTKTVEIAVFIHGYCGQLLAGQVPDTTDHNTVAWLNQNLTGLRALLGR